MIEEASLTSISERSGPPVTLMITPRAPSTEAPSSSGLEMARLAASIARFSPSAIPVPIVARPMPAMIVFTSAKSRFIRPGTRIRSEMPWMACRNTSSAVPNAWLKLVLRLMIESSRSFGIVITVSTQSRSASRPASAWSWRFLPSNLKGLVTTAMVSAPTPRPFVSLLPICSFTGAGFACSACRSVLATMNSTPSKPAWTMRLTALPPPPPTPITLMRAPARRSSSSISRNSFGWPSTRSRTNETVRFGSNINASPCLHRALEELPEQRPEPPRESCDRADAHRAAGFRRLAALCKKCQSHRRCEGRTVDVVREAADANRRPAPDGEIKDLLGDLGQPVEDGAAAGEHDPGIERFFVSRTPDFVPHQVEDLFRARLQDLRQDAPRHDACAPAAHARDFHRFVLVHHRRERAPALALQLLGVRDGHTETDGDVVGEVITADADDRRVPEAAAFENGDVGRTAADVDQRDAELLLVRREHRLAGRDLLDDAHRHLRAGPVHAGDDVVDRGRARRHDVDVDLEPGARHPDWRPDAVLFVDDEVLRQHVQDLPAVRQRNSLRRIDCTPHVVARDLPALARHGNDAAAVET